MSWARSTVTQLERSLGRSENYFDRILIGVLVLLAIAVAVPLHRELTRSAAAPIHCANSSPQENKRDNESGDDDVERQ